MVFGWGNGKYVSSCGRSPAVGNYYATTALAFGELKVVQPKREIYIYANGTKVQATPTRILRFASH